MSQSKPLFDTNKGIMHVAGFMSGKGTTLRKVIEFQRDMEDKFGSAPYKVALIFTNRQESNAENIAEDWKIPYVSLDVKNFCLERGKRYPKLHEEYFSEVKKIVDDFQIDLIALCGFDLIVYEPLLSSFLIINSHPADLSIMEGKKRKYTGLIGAKEVLRQIIGGENKLRTTTHIVTKDVDGGPILMRSKPVKVNLIKAAKILGGVDSNKITLDYLKQKENNILLEKISEVHQEWLKEAGDWIIMPKTIQYIALGKFILDDKDNVIFKDKDIP